MIHEILLMNSLMDLCCFLYQKLTLWKQLWKIILSDSSPFCAYSNRISFYPRLINYLFSKIISKESHLIEYFAVISCLVGHEKGNLRLGTEHNTIKAWLEIE